MSDDDRYRRFNLRIPKAAFEQLQRAADARSHSMNAEIVQRLVESLSLKDVGYTGDQPPDFSGVELGMIGIFRDLEEEEKRAILVLLRNMAIAKNAP